MKEVPRCDVDFLPGRGKKPGCRFYSFGRNPEVVHSPLQCLHCILQLHWHAYELEQANADTVNLWSRSLHADHGKAGVVVEEAAGAVS